MCRTRSFELRAQIRRETKNFGFFARAVVVTLRAHDAGCTHVATLRAHGGVKYFETSRGVDRNVFEYAVELPSSGGCRGGGWWRSPVDLGYGVPPPPGGGPPVSRLLHRLAGRKLAQSTRLLWEGICQKFRHSNAPLWRKLPKNRLSTRTPPCGWGRVGADLGLHFGR